MSVECFLYTQKRFEVDEELRKADREREKARRRSQISGILKQINISFLYHIMKEKKVEQSFKNKFSRGRENKIEKRATTMMMVVVLCGA